MRSKKPKFVSKEDVEKIGKLPAGHAHPVRKLLEVMEVGQTIHVLRQDWNWQNKTPNVIVFQMNRRGPKRYEFSDAADDSGWFIERVA